MGKGETEGGREAERGEGGWEAERVRERERERKLLLFMPDAHIYMGPLANIVSLQQIQSLEDVHVDYHQPLHEHLGFAS